jgi:hypothetical protein
MWRLGFTGEIDEAGGPRSVHSVENGREYVAYSLDRETRFVFQFK